MKRNISLPLAFMLSLALPLGAQSADMASSGGSGSVTQASESYVINSLDVLRFRVVGEDETATEVRVSADGTVTLPYVGKVRVAEMTVSQAREHLFRLYDADYYVDPQIDMAVVGYRQRRINVQGMVNAQGLIVIPPEEEMTLLEAISAAGGWRTDRMADKGNVVLTRTRPDGSTEVHKIDANRIKPGDWVLRDGDYIDVKERIW